MGDETQAKSTPGTLGLAYGSAPACGHPPAPELVSQVSLAWPHRLDQPPSPGSHTFFLLHRHPQGHTSASRPTLLFLSLPVPIAGSPRGRPREAGTKHHQRRSVPGSPLRPFPLSPVQSASAPCCAHARAHRHVQVRGVCTRGQTHGAETTEAPKEVCALTDLGWGHTHPAAPDPPGCLPAPHLQEGFPARCSYHAPNKSQLIRALPLNRSPSLR